MPRGGKRPHSGLPKGYKFKHTIQKEIERERLRQLVIQYADPMTRAQISNAMGLKYLVTRDRLSGKFIRVTQAMAKAKQGSLPPDGLADLAKMVLDRGTLSEKDLGLMRSLFEEWQEARTALNAHAATEEIVEVWEKDPNISAYADLMNRALDKPAEQVKVTGPEGGPLEIKVTKPW